MKKIISYLVFIILLIILILVYINQNSIVNYIASEYVYKNMDIKQYHNRYTKLIDVDFVKMTDDFHPDSKQDLYNIFYTSLNNGVNSFMYYCDKDYEDCMKDTKEIANDQSNLSIINNFVHPYNSYKQLNFSINSYNLIEVDIIKQYDQDEINQLETKINKLITNLTNNQMKDYDKMIAIHDYIINSSTYDNIKADYITNNNNPESPYSSEKATGVLFEGKGICSGYSDTFDIFLYKLGIAGYKISSPTHIWNLIKTNEGWKHIDLTWDNPNVSDGSKLLLHDYFLIDYQTLKKLDPDHHNFDNKVFTEAL